MLGTQRNRFAVALGGALLPWRPLLAAPFPSQAHPALLGSVLSESAPGRACALTWLGEGFSVRLARPSATESPRDAASPAHAPGHADAQPLPAHPGSLRAGRRQAGRLLQDAPRPPRPRAGPRLPRPPRRAAGFLQPVQPD